MQNAGFPVTTVDPRRLQLFYKGQEQAIFVNGQGDAVFNTTDFIEFFGEANYGENDARLYQPESAQPHSYYSIYTDTSSYFLTYNLTPVNGKRMTSYSENNTGGLPALTSENEQILQINATTYSPGQGYSAEEFTRYTFFDIGEGWTSAAIQENQNADFVLSGINDQQVSDGVPRLELLLVGRDNLSHNVSISVGPNSSSLRSLGSVQFENYNTQLFTSNLLWSDISAAGSLTVRVSALGVSGGNDLMSTSYLKLDYPRQFDMNSVPSELFTLPIQASNKSYIEIVNSPAQTQLYDVTDVNNVVRVGSNTIGGGISAIINGTLSERKIWANGATFKTPVIRRSNFRDIDPSNHNYLIISHKRLMQPASGSSNPVKSFAGYRSSTAGGDYDTLVVDIQLLFNQFNYGISSPLAIYDFMRFMVDNGSPEFLFIIGKGLGPSLNFYRNPAGVINITQSGVSYQIRDLVPSAGTPGSDMVFTAGLGATIYEPAVPVGRLPARSSDQVMNYLNKVIEMESTPFDDLWRKNILHLSGGISEAELVNFRGFMDGFEAVAEDVFLGGDVRTIAKTSGSTIELINVADEVNEGLNLITFYGHSAPGIIDIDIGFVTDPTLGYNNTGRYPFFLINGCNAGQFFNASVTFGEDWILAENKGALGFIAHSSFGFVSNLKRYSDFFYEIGFGDSVFVSKPIAEVQQEVARSYMAESAISENNITQVQQMVLLGDPAIKLFGPEVPDYAITENDISVEAFNNEVLTASLDSFAVKLTVRNFGRTRNDSIKVSISRTLSNNSIINYDSIFPSVKYLDTLIFCIKNNGENGFGNNTFSVLLDSDFTIPELDENNNSASVDAFIPLFGTSNLYPINYAIVNEQPVQFIAQSSDLLEGTREFLFQLDTTANFNSPFLKSTTVNAKLIARWNTDLLPNVPANDSIVYYWRTKFSNAQSGESEEWVESSFIFINQGQEGWSQSEFPQLKSNVFNGLEVDIANEEIEYLKTIRDLSIITFGSDTATNVDVSVRINNLEYNIDNQKRCRNNTVNLIAFNKNDAIPYAAVPLIFQDNRTCGRTPQVINSFTFAELESGSNDITDYIDNVNDGDSVVLYTIGNPMPQSWSANVLSKLEEIGASSANITSLQSGEPYILYGKKGSAIGSATEFKTSETPASEQQLTVNLTVTGIQSSGNVLSGLIGPANNWNSIEFRAINELSDNFDLDVIGVDLNRNETVLLSGTTVFPIDISTISAAEYPFLRLRFNNSDNQNLTPPTINKWQVIYTPVAEGILVAETPNFDVLNVQEGQPVQREYKFVNISNHSFLDSLQVRQEVFTRSFSQNAIKTFNIFSPEPGDTTSFSTAVVTRGKVGTNDYKISVNPRVEPEQYYDNNILDLRSNILVAEDEIDPLLDVLFDGRYILNGDIVSPTPQITIRLKDENPYIQVSDTTAMQIFIKKECETCNFSRVPFSSNQINWTAATAEEDFKVEYRPNRLEDGTYTLRVEAMDEAGNLSGEEPYLISFEVINESTVTNFYPYPNPFSTSTRFVFTLTGSDIPNEIIIQIMTVTGKVVREITQDEIGPIFIGNNLTDYAWDGRDEFGDQLANGVYLYRVFIKKGGEAVKQRSTSADKAFKNGFGKLYILR
ncbi:MAG: C25 family cysteine peptidase [Fulvivirga sp.]|uniref:putative type IX secretion system sortase PorU2 n=1 Tax=Fulvivirga sp. TaxID=1931237 RepID=UPI0032F091EC